MLDAKSKCHQRMQTGNVIFREHEFDAIKILVIFFWIGTDEQKTLLMDAFLRRATEELSLSNTQISFDNLKRGDVVKLCGATASLLYALIPKNNVFTILI